MDIHKEIIKHIIARNTYFCQQKDQVLRIWSLKKIIEN